MKVLNLSADMYPAERQQPREHAAGIKEITGLKITMAGAGGMSKPLAEVENIGIVSFRYGEEHLAEVTFDEGKSGQMQDLRPSLPLILRW